MFPAESRTSTGKVVLYEIKTGVRIERWTVDAREILRAQPDDYTLDPTKCERPAQPAPPAEAPITQNEVPKTHPLGGPVVATKSSEAAPAQPLAAPQRSRGRKATS